MFNSNLTSSISGWLSNTFPGKENENQEQKDGENQEQNDAENQEQKDGGKDQKITGDEVNEAPPAEGSNESEIKEEKEHETVTSESNETNPSVMDMNAEQMQKKVLEETQKVMTSAKSFGTYLFGVATEATKKVSSTVNETASTLKKTVEEKTIIGELNREQKDFIRQKRERQGGDAVPPWYGYHEEDSMKKQILALSNDPRNFLRSPPSGVQFQFDFEQMLPVAMVSLKEDEKLSAMRFRLVPTKIKEERFWKNYFYRVSLIKQSAQLSTLTEMQQKSSTDVASSESSASSIVLVGGPSNDSISRNSSSRSLNKTDAGSALVANEGESQVLTGSPDDIPNAEFASDAFDPSLLNPDDLEREMKELGMNEQALPEWEHELQRELQDYEVVNDNKKEDAWEDELDNMLNEEPLATA